MRIGKRERAALKLEQQYALGNRARYARAGEKVQMRLSCHIEMPVGKPVINRWWKNSEHMSLVMRQRGWKIIK